jgi:hypothetical protein
MKKCSVFFFVYALFALPFCTSTKKVATAEPLKLTYASALQPIIMSNCSPCHIPPKGNKKAYDNYANVKSDIDEIITRIQKDPSEKGFMPFKHAKLPDSTIQVFVQWKADGSIEK